MTRKTIFGDFRQAASAVYRVTTQSSVYIVGFHEERGRHFVVVRGLPGTDREHVVIRDGDPRVGSASMFELSPEAWVGQPMEVATMTTSAITGVTIESDRAAIASVGGDLPTAHQTWKHASAPSDPPPAWAPRSPAPPHLMVGVVRGTNPAIVPRGVGYQVVVGQPAPPPAAEPTPDLPYPQRHVQYTENAAAFLRSVARRDRLFEDVAQDRALQQRLYRALDDCADLLEQLRRRSRR